MKIAYGSAYLNFRTADSRAAFERLLAFAGLMAMTGCGGRTSLGGGYGDGGIAGRGGNDASVDARDAALSDGSLPQRACTLSTGGRSPSCGADEYCNVPFCGATGVTGFCIKRPTACSGICPSPGVCGCDRARHCSECEANFQGVSIDSSDSACSVDPIVDGGIAPLVDAVADVPTAPHDVQYSAFALQRLSPYFVVFKLDRTADTCVAIEVISKIQPTTSLTAIGADAAIKITAQRIAGGAEAQCSVPGRFSSKWRTTPDGTAGTGTITIAQGATSCSLSISGTVTFPSSPTESLSAANVLLTGDCPVP